MNYPLGKHTDIASKTGKKMSEITLSAVTGGTVTPEDIKISRTTLNQQSRVAPAAARPQLAANFDRAAELADVPDDVILDIYGKLRPYRATKAELLEIADTLENTYKARQCARLVRDAAEVYEKRGILA